MSLLAPMMLALSACGGAAHTTGTSDAASRGSSLSAAKRSGGAAAPGDPTPVACPDLQEFDQVTGLTLGAADPLNTPPSYCSYQQMQGGTPMITASLWQPPPHLGADSTWTLDQYQDEAKQSHHTPTAQASLGSGAFSTEAGEGVCNVFFVPPGHVLVVEAQVRYFDSAGTDACGPAIGLASAVAGVAPASSGDGALTADATCAQALAAGRPAQEALIRSFRDHFTATFGSEDQTVQTMVGVIDTNCPTFPDKKVTDLLYGLGYYGN